MEKYYIRGVFDREDNWIEVTPEEFEDYRTRLIDTLLEIPDTTREAVEAFAATRYKIVRR